MSYQALARKWRPLTFAEVVGQEHVTRTLANAVASNRIHHAYLFTGARGVGKTTVARILARALNCEKGPTPEPCNSCAPCQEILRGSSVDVLEIDGASNTGVDDVREIKENVRYQPANGRYKIFIIDEVHMLSNSAFNALLKTLEEPPPHAAFIFATTEPQKILSTILSRCQRFDFQRLPIRQLTAKLRRIAEQEGVEVPDSALYTLARAADGSMRDAESLLDQAIAYAGRRITDQHLKDALGAVDRREMADLARSILERRPADALGAVDRLYEGGADVKILAGELLQIFRHLAVLRICGEKDGRERGLVDLPDEEAADLAGMAASHSSEDVQLLFHLLMDGMDAVLRHPHPRLGLEMALLKMTSTPPVAHLADLIRRLDALIGGAASPAGLTPPPGKTTPAPEPAGPGREGWDRFVAHVRIRRPPLASLLEWIKFIELKEDEARLGILQRSIYSDMLKDPEKQAQFQQLLDEFMGRPMKIAWVTMGDQDFVADAEVKERAMDRERKERESRVLQEKPVQAARQLFSAEVKEIKFLKEE